MQTTCSPLRSAAGAVRARRSLHRAARDAIRDDDTELQLAAVNGLVALYSGRGKSSGLKGGALLVANSLLEGESMATVVLSAGEELSA